MSLNKTTNIKFSDLRKEFTTNTNNPIKYSSFYPTSNINTVDINNIPNLPVANSSMRLSYFKSVGKTLFNIIVSGTESTTKTIPQPVLVNNISNNYYLRLLHQGNNNTSTTANYTEYNIRFPFTVNAEVLLVGGGGGGGAGYGSFNYGAGGNAGGLIYTNSYTFTENTTYKIRIGAGGLGMQSFSDGTTIDGTSSIIYDNTNTPLLIALGGKIGRYGYGNSYSYINYSTNLFAVFTTNTTSFLLPAKGYIKYNYDDTTIINNVLRGTYNISFLNGVITFGTLAAHIISYPILKNENTLNPLNPLIWYKFDASPGLLVNSGSLSIGNLINSSTAVILSTSIVFHGTSSAYFTTNSFFTMPTGIDFYEIIDTSGISISCCVYFISLSGYTLPTIYKFGKITGAFGDSNFSLIIETSTINKYFTFYMIDGENNTDYYTINSPLSLNKWYNIIWSININGYWTIYINNQKIDPEIYKKPQQVSVQNRTYYIGQKKFPLDGSADIYIDDFRIYDFVLTDAQVAELYNGRVEVYIKAERTTKYGNDVLLSQNMDSSISSYSRLYGFANVNGNNGNVSYQVFSYTGNIETYTIPPNINYINIYCWGAGGGGGAAFLNGYTAPGGYGGDGGFVMGILDVSGITSLKIIVGQGGRKGVQAGRCGFAYGGGGDAGNIGNGNWASGGGGGLSGVFVDNANITITNNIINSAATAILIAGGGGGSALNFSRNGGNAGGTNGNAADGTNPGGGGTSATGGSGNETGTKFNGGSLSTNYLGGGGGGGYYGGGASSYISGNTPSGGGGGSSYINTTDFIFTNTIIPNSQPNGTRIVYGNTNKYYQNNAGLGANIGLNNGYNGLIVIEYTSINNFNYNSGGGGGGANSAGGVPNDLNSGTGGNGGNAKLINITGDNEYYAAGGGGSSYLGTVGLGGIGASGVYLGGNGTNNSSSTKISNAVANTGSGGGGSACDGANPSIGGNGSAGICIIKYFPYIYYPPLTITNFTSSLISTNKYNITINTLNYLVKFSSSLTTNNDPYVLLDRNTGTNWNTGSSTYTNLGTYTGGAYLVNDYTGEWMYYKFPYSIMLKEYKISATVAKFPLLWKIYGSNDESNWTEITDASNNTTDAVYTSSIYTKTLTNYARPYKYIGIVIKKASNSGSNSFVFDGFEVSGLIFNLTNNILIKTYTFSTSTVPYNFTIPSDYVGLYSLILNYITNVRNYGSYDTYNYYTNYYINNILIGSNNSTTDAGNPNISILDVNLQAAIILNNSSINFISNQIISLNCGGSVYSYGYSYPYINSRNLYITFNYLVYLNN